MCCFGVSESLVISGSVFIVNGRVTEGLIAMAIGVITGFVRYTTWIGMSKEK